jgi:deoxyribonuclease (pyrimidine dimer)
MTRINAGIPPRELTGKHLLAEHREIKRVPNLIRKGKYSLENQPDKFKLGTGHVKFFYNKLLYLKNRYLEIHEECIRRGYNVTNYLEAWNDIPSHLMKDYIPTKEGIEIIKERIREKLKKK